MDSVRKARVRLARYSEVLGQCQSEGVVYASCVLKQEQVAHNSCLGEFQIFKKCLLKSASRLGTKL